MSSTPLPYPSLPKGPVVDVHHGVPVADPYRWLEEDTPATQAFVKDQQAVFAAYAASSGFPDLRASLRASMEAKYNYARVGAPQVKGGRAFFFRNTGLQNQDVLLQAPAAAQPRTLEELPEPTSLLDLNAEFPAGTTSLSTYAFSEDGSKLAYALAHGGSDWVTIKVRDVATGADLPLDVIPWVKFSGISWLKDGSGFFYSRYPSPPDVVVAAEGAPADAKDAGTETATNVCASVMFHALGTAAGADLLVHATPEQPQWRAGAHVSECGAFLFLSTSKSTDPVNRLYVARTATFAAWRARAAPYAPAPGELPPATHAHPYLPFRRVIDNFEAQYDVVAAVGGRRLYLQTNLDAPRGRLLALELPPEDAPEWEHAAPLFPAGAPPPAHIDAPAAPTPAAALHEVLPQHGAEVLDWVAHVAGDKLVACLMKDVVNVLRVYALPGAGAPLSAPLGAPTEVPLPGPGTVASFVGRPELPRAYFKFVSFTTPGTTLSLDLSGALPTELPPAQKYWGAALPGFVPEDFVVKQEFVTAKDGARIPLFLVHKKGLALPAPTLLYAYGGFNISMQPSFSPLRLPWLSQLGGVFALACIRGGGEYGEEAWHKAGARLNKRTSFNDFCAVAAELAARGVTTAPQLAIMGGSNGGLLTLAASLRTPALFGAAVSQVPVADFLRFGLHTIGHAWRGEYGFVEDREDFFNMLCLSPCASPQPSGCAPGAPAICPPFCLTPPTHTHHTHTHHTRAHPPLPRAQTTRRSPRRARRPPRPSPPSWCAPRTTTTAWCRCTATRWWRRCRRRGARPRCSSSRCCCAWNPRRGTARGSPRARCWTSTRRCTASSQRRRARCGRREGGVRYFVGVRGKMG